MSLKKVNEIVSGFKNIVFPSEYHEKLAMERAKICGECEHARPDHPFKRLSPEGETIKIKGMGCNRCGCLLSAKVRSPMSECPEKKW